MCSTNVHKVQKKGQKYNTVYFMYICTYCTCNSGKYLYPLNKSLIFLKKKYMIFLWFWLIFVEISHDFFLLLSRIRFMKRIRIRNTGFRKPIRSWPLIFAVHSLLNCEEKINGICSQYVSCLSYPVPCFQLTWELSECYGYNKLTKKKRGKQPPRADLK